MRYAVRDLHVDCMSWAVSTDQHVWVPAGEADSQALDADGCECNSALQWWSTRWCWWLIRCWLVMIWWTAKKTMMTMLMLKFTGWSPCRGLQRWTSQKCAGLVCSSRLPWSPSIKHYFLTKFLDALASLESTVVGEWVSQSVSHPQFRQGHNAAP